MIETLTNIKNNKLKRNATHDQGGEAVERMKKFLLGLAKKRHGSSALHLAHPSGTDEPLQSLDTSHFASRSMTSTLQKPKASGGLWVLLGAATPLWIAMRTQPTSPSMAMQPVMQMIMSYLVSP